MGNFEEIEYRQFDQVRLRTIQNVKYLSAPPDQPVVPAGIWSVAAVIVNDDGKTHDLLVIKQSATIRIPAKDVLKVAAYDINAITQPLGRMTDGQNQSQGRQRGRQEEQED